MFERLSQYLFVRHRHNWGLLYRFSLVGGSGFVVNLAVFGALMFAVGHHDRVFVPVPGTEFNVRHYHAFSTLAFLVANASNYLLNRWWAFKSRGAAHWLSEYVPFLAIGLLAQGLGLLVLTALVKFAGLGDNALEVSFAQALTIVVVTPVSFVGNKVWTFRAVRTRHREHLDRADGDEAGGDDS